MAQIVDMWTVWTRVVGLGCWDLGFGASDLLLPI